MSEAAVAPARRETDQAAAMAKLRRTMVDRQLRPFDVTDAPLLDQFLATPRELFLPEHQADLAYSDLAVTLRTSAGGKRSLLPPLVAALGLILGGMVAFGTHMRTAFFPVLVISSAGLGALFLGKKLPLDLAAVGTAALLPWLLPVLFHRHAVCAYRARKRSKDLEPLK